MSISSVSNAPAQPVPTSRANQEEKVEGTAADGDGDKDDVKPSNTVVQTSKATQVTESLGNYVNVSA